jgi:hypothetical protein
MGKYEGQIEFQRLLMKAEDLRKSSYRSDKLCALDKIDAEDKQTYIQRRCHGEMLQVKVRDLTCQLISNVDKFKVMTINEFSEWKKRLQTNLSDEF